MSLKRSKWCAFLALTLSLVLILPILAACGSSKEKNTPTPMTTATPEGAVTGNEDALPVLTVRDKWVLKTVSGGKEYIATTEVIGEEVVNDKDCYVATISMDTYNVKEWIDKTTLFPIKDESNGSTTTYSYQFEGDPLYPLQINNEFKIAMTVITTSKETGESNTEKNTYLYKVEKIEQITVQAGTFRCFKIVEYDKDGTPTATRWKSYETKMYLVKGVESQSNVTTELVSYSVSK